MKDDRAVGAGVATPSARAGQAVLPPTVPGQAVPGRSPEAGGTPERARATRLSDHARAGAARPEERGPGRDLGDRILRRVSQSVGSQRSARNLEGDAIVTVENGCVRVTVASEFQAEYLGRNFMAAIRRAAAVELAASGGGQEPVAGDVPLEIVVEPGAFARQANADPRPGAGHTEAPAVPGRGAGIEAGTPTPPRAPERTGPGRATRVTTIRDLRHKLDDFVVGECNRIGYTAALAIADGNAPPRFSPMFLHGPSGVGKTHLLQGLAVRAHQRLGGRVRYTTAEAFTNEFVAAVKSGSTEAFRRSFRDVEILCIDDIHFLSSKSATQAEFLHTLNTLGLSGRMVVLASDEAPRDLRSMAEALISRFLSGAVIRVDPPDERTRVDLIRRLSASRGLALDDEAVHVLSERAGRPLPGGSVPSVREIEGLLTRVEATRNFMAPGEFATPGGVIGASLVARALGLTTTGTGHRPVAISLIVDRTCRSLRVDASDLMGRGRHARVVLARALVTYLARRLTTMSYPEIARSIGRPNHSSVITAFNRVTGQMEAGQAVGGGPDLGGVTIQALAERLEREIVSAAG